MYENVVFATCHNKTNFFHFEDEDLLKVDIVVFPGSIRNQTENVPSVIIIMILAGG